MTGKRPVHPAVADFLGDLRDLRTSCGLPSYRTLAHLSEELSSRYPGRDLPTLSASAISEILGGRRVDLPSSAWVASLVLCAHQYAWQIGRLSENPGIEALPAWQERLQAARATASASAPGVTAEPAEPAPPGPLAAPQHEHVASHGAYGQVLLAELETGDPDAAYRVAVVLAAAPEHRDAAIALLLRAGTARHLLALELLEVDAARFEETVADHACALARAADGHDAAVVLYACAARCRSVTGLVELSATLLAERGGQKLAEAIRVAHEPSRSSAAVRPDVFPSHD